MAEITKEFTQCHELLKNVVGMIDSYVASDVKSKGQHVATLSIIVAEIITKFLVANDNVERSIHMLERIMNESISCVYEGGAVEFRTQEKEVELKH